MLFDFRIFTLAKDPEHPDRYVGFEVELAGSDGLRYDDWTMRRPEHANFFGRGPGYRYLRARGNSWRGIALTLSPGVPAARCGPVPPRTGHDVIAPDAHTPTVPS